MINYRHEAVTKDPDASVPILAPDDEVDVGLCPAVTS